VNLQEKTFSFFNPSNDKSTRKYGPIVAVGTSNDVFPCEFVTSRNKTSINHLQGVTYAKKPNFPKNVMVCDWPAKMNE
jgi:hypothetical protein